MGLRIVGYEIAYNAFRLFSMFYSFFFFLYKYKAFLMFKTIHLKQLLNWSKQEFF